MNKYSYRISNLGMPSREENIVEADEYRIEKNERSEMNEHVFYKDGKIVLIIPHYLLDGFVRRVDED